MTQLTFKTAGRGLFKMSSDDLLLIEHTSTTSGTTYQVYCLSWTRDVADAQYVATIPSTEFESFKKKFPNAPIQPKFMD